MRLIPQVHSLVPFPFFALNKNYYVINVAGFVAYNALKITLKISMRKMNKKTFWNQCC